jgi:hypothetical protein
MITQQTLLEFGPRAAVCFYFGGLVRGIEVVVMGPKNWVLVHASFCSYPLYWQSTLSHFVIGIKLSSRPRKVVQHSHLYVCSSSQAPEGAW